MDYKKLYAAIEQLTEQLNEANRLVGDYIKICDDGQKEIDELQNKCELLEKDAARYRFLRERDIDEIEKGGVFAGLTPDNLVLNGMDLDSAIDSAMATFERPKPTPQVEFGQVWRCFKNNENYKVENIGVLKSEIIGEWVDCVSYRNVTNSGAVGERLYTRTLSDFLAKFERVS